MALCTLREKENCLIVTLPRTIDHIMAQDLEKELREYIGLKPKALLCDMSGAEYVSSSGLRVILAVAKAAKLSGVHFGVFALTKFASHIFSMTGFTQLVAIYLDEKAALLAAARY